MSLKRYDFHSASGEPFMREVPHGKWALAEEAVQRIAALEADVGRERALKRNRNEVANSLADKLEKMKAALELAATRLEILTGRMRACREETGAHALLDEAVAFCEETREACARVDI